MQVLNDIATAAHLLGQAIARLDQVRLDPATTSEERDQIMMVLPRLRLRRRELDAEFDALAAEAQRMPPPSEETVRQIKSATEALAQQAGNAQMADLILTSATALVNAARSLSAGVT